MLKDNKILLPTPSPRFQVLNGEDEEFDAGNNAGCREDNFAIEEFRCCQSLWDDVQRLSSLPHVRLLLAASPRST
jgi:hypothetical protein